MNVTLIKTPSGSLQPYGEEAQDEVRKIKAGAVVNCKLTRMRNYKFFKKMFALWGVLFDIWSDTVPRMEYLGIQIAPNRKRFRGDMTILAGYYVATVNLKGEVRLDPASISYASMEEDDFEKLFSAMIDIGLRKVLTHTTISDADLRAAVDRVLSFDS